MALTYSVKLLDFQSTSVPGSLLVTDNGLQFNSANTSISLTISWSTARAIVIGEIGKRERSGPFLELSAYITDNLKQMYTFSAIPLTEKESLLSLLRSYLGDNFPILDRHYVATGWNWGSLAVSSAAVSFIPNSAIALAESGASRVNASANEEGGPVGGDDASSASEDSEASQINEDPVEDLYFHIPTTMVDDLKSLGAREISLTLHGKTSETNALMSVKEIVFTIPDKQVCKQMYDRLMHVVDTRTSGRIVSIPELSVFTTKSSKFTLEINLRSFRFFSWNNNYHRLPDTITKYFFVEKPSYSSESVEYFFVIMFTQGNGFVKGLDSICMLLPQRKLTREIILPRDPDVADSLRQEMLCDNPRIYDEDNPPYGPYSLLSARNTGIQAYGVTSEVDRHIAVLNGVETYMVIPRLFHYLTPKKSFVCTEHSQTCLDKKVYSSITYSSIRIREGYGGHATYPCVECKNRVTQQKTVYLYFLDKRQGLLMLPYATIYIPYTSISRVALENDASRGATGKKNPVKLVVSTAGIVHEFTSIDRDHCDVIEQYLRGCGVTISVSLQASNKSYGGMFGDVDIDDMGGDDSDDADFEAVPDSSSGEYSEDFEEINSDESEAGENHDHEVQALKARTERTKKRATFECYADIRSQDCLLAVPNPSSW